MREIRRASRERSIGYAAGVTAAGIVLLFVVGMVELLGGTTWISMVVLGGIFVLLGSLAHSGATSRDR